MDVNDLKRERMALVNDGKRLLESVETKGRALTDEERRTDDARADKIAALGATIDGLERQELDGELPAGSFRPISRSAGNGRSAVPGVRELRNGENAFRPGTYGKSENMDLGHLVAALATGSAEGLTNE